MEITRPLKAIRQYCLDCSAGSPSEVRKCVIENCPLYPFRFGKNPFRKGRVLTPAEKQLAREKMMRLREQGKL